jgi:hypothetical protein
MKRFDFAGANRSESPDGYYVFAQDYLDTLELLRIAEVAIRTNSNPPKWWAESVSKVLDCDMSQV